MKKSDKVVIVVIIVCLFIMIGNNIKEYLNRNPIVVQHPCPNLIMKFSFLEALDKHLHFTAGLIWAYVTEKETGTKYLVRVYFDWYKSKETIEVIDYIKREKWETVTKEELLERFDINEKTRMFMNWDDWEVK